MCLKKLLKFDSRNARIGVRMTSEMHFEVGGKLLTVHGMEVRLDFQIGYQTSGSRHWTTGWTPEREENPLESDRTTGLDDRTSVWCLICFILLCWHHLSPWIF